MQVISYSPKDTLAFGQAIARYLKPQDILCLSGGLGSGKTVLSKGIAKGLGLDHSLVTSPSFVLIREYPGARIPLYHFDFYRLKEAQDIAGLGYEEYFYGRGVSVVEWPGRMKYLIPYGHLKIELICRGRLKRALRFSARGRRYKELLEQIRRSRAFREAMAKNTKGRGE